MVCYVKGDQLKKIECSLNVNFSGFSYWPLPSESSEVLLKILTYCEPHQINFIRISEEGDLGPVLDKLSTYFLFSENLRTSASLH